MSHTEGRSSTPPEEEDEEDEGFSPISAIAPEADSNHEQPAVLSSNPALQCLEEVKALFSFVSCLNQLQNFSHLSSVIYIAIIHSIFLA